MAGERGRRAAGGAKDVKTMSHENNHRPFRESPEHAQIREVIGRVLAEHGHRHPGIITEVIVEILSQRYEILPRPGASEYAEKRKNHTERIRRLSHAVFRAVDTAARDEASQRIADVILKAFVLVPRNEPFPGQEGFPP